MFGKKHAVTVIPVIRQREKERSVMDDVKHVFRGVNFFIFHIILSLYLYMLL